MKIIRIHKMFSINQNIDDSYSNYIIRDNLLGSDTIIVNDLNNNQISLLFKHSGSPELFKKLAKTVKKEHNCTECMPRIMYLGRYSDINGDPIVLKNVSRTQKQSDIRECIEQILNTPIINIECVPNQDNQNNLLFPPTSGFEAVNIPYYHYNAYIANCSDKDINLTKIQKAFDRYAPELIPELLKKTTLQGVQEGFDLIEDVLKSVSYGQTWLPALRWIRSNTNYNYNTQTVRNKWLMVANTILSAPITIGENDQSLITFYHQVNNSLLKIMTSNCKTKVEMQKFIASMLSPTNYQRPTAPPKEGNIKNAMKELGDFKNTVMLVSEFEKYGGVLIKNQNSSMSAFSNMLKQKETKINKLTSFASRMLPTRITTMTQLINGIKDGTIKNVKVTNNMTAVAAYTTTLDRNKRLYDFFWSFFIGQSLSLFVNKTN